MTGEILAGSDREYRSSEVPAAGFRKAIDELAELGQTAMRHETTAEDALWAQGGLERGLRILDLIFRSQAGSWAEVVEARRIEMFGGTKDDMSTDVPKAPYPPEYME